MKWKECKQLIKDDYSRLNKRRFGMIGYLITNHSFKITFWFRLGSYLKEKGGICKILLVPIWLIYKHNQYKTGIQLPFCTNVGGGLKFSHFGTIIVHYDAILGRNCTIFQGVTIGSMRGKGNPKIGNNVVMFSGARIIGNVTLGDNSVIGAGAVVVKNVESGDVVAGVPAKVVSHNGNEIANLYL